MLKHMQGNLITLAEEGHFNIIVHGANCFNTMGKGIAKEIRARYPQAYAVDCTTTAGDRTKVGTYSVMIGKQFNIINAYTQFSYFSLGTKQTDLFEYDGFEDILDKLVTAYPTCNFGLPYIGMGLAGGNSDRIMAMIELFAVKVVALGGSVTLVEFGR